MRKPRGHYQVPVYSRKIFLIFHRYFYEARSDIGTVDSMFKLPDPMGCHFFGRGVHGPFGNIFVVPRSVITCIGKYVETGPVSQFFQNIRITAEIGRGTVKKSGDAIFLDLLQIGQRTLYDFAPFPTVLARAVRPDPIDPDMLMDKC